MTIKYEIKRYGKDRIVPINCVRETEKTLWIEFERNGQRSVVQRRKCSDFHDTWQSAHDWLITMAHAKIDSARRSLQRDEAELVEIKSLTEKP
jgi:hypothetical protein